MSPNLTGYRAQHVRSTPISREAPLTYHGVILHPGVGRVADYHFVPVSLGVVIEPLTDRPVATLRQWEGLIRTHYQRNFKRHGARRNPRPTWPEAAE